MKNPPKAYFIIRRRYDESEIHKIPINDLSAGNIKRVKNRILKNMDEGRYFLDENEIVHAVSEEKQVIAKAEQ